MLNADNRLTCTLLWKINPMRIMRWHVDLYIADKHFVKLSLLYP